MKNNSKGFTIIELLVVISIIGLLSTISVVALNGARKKSRDAKRIADINNLQTALELYYNDNNGYPIFTSAITLGPTTAYGKLGYGSGCGTAGFVTSASSCTTTYMGLVPANPTPTVTNGAYTYTGPSADYYVIAFPLEDTTGGLSAGWHYGTSYGIQ